ncbi:MAG TPA: hypothetical protein VF845_00205 [Terriglobales bacterium]
MDFDEIGNRLFLITDKGLTVVQLTSPPLSVGYLNPAFGSIAGGTTVSIRGRDSNRAQLSASAGLGQRQHSSMEARSKLSRPRVRQVGHEFPSATQMELLILSMRDLSTKNNGCAAQTSLGADFSLAKVGSLFWERAVG